MRVILSRPESNFFVDKQENHSGAGLCHLCPVMGERSAQPTIGPLLGERTSLAEHDRDVGVTNLDGGEKLGDPSGLDVFELEDRREPVLDDKAARVIVERSARRYVRLPSTSDEERSASVFRSMTPARLSSSKTA